MNQKALRGGKKANEGDMLADQESLETGRKLELNQRRYEV